MPNRPRFSLPDRSKFHLPERPKFNLPDKAKFHLPERPKFNLKKPNIRLPGSLTRAKKSPVEDQRSTDSNVGSSTRRNIFDFSTYPRIFDKKSKIRGEYATSTPKDSRAQSAENSTFPRTRKGVPMSERWVQRFEEPAYIDEDRSDGEPRVAAEAKEEAEIPWEEKRRQEQLQYMDYEPESTEVSASDRQPHRRSDSRTEEESYEKERMEMDPRVYGDRVAKDEDVEAEEDWVEEKQREDFRPIQRSRSLEEVLRTREEKQYEGSFAIVDPRMYGVHKTPSEEEEEYEEEMEEEEELEPSSAQSDREHQHSSGSSCDRRRRGVIEEIDSDEFYLREGGLSQDDMNLRKYLTHEIRDALRADAINALADEDMIPIPPQRPMRKRALRKQEDSVESYDMMPPVRPRRDPNRARRSESTDEQFRERTRSDSRHRIVYQTEGIPQELPQEPLDDIVIVKPARRKSRSSLRSQSLAPQEAPRPPSPTPPPPVIPTRRKRVRKGTPIERRNGESAPICNGHTDWADSAPEKPLPLPPAELDQLPDEVYTAEEILAASEENLQKRLQDEDYMEPAPVPPKRRSRSRGTSVAQDEDRTSHGAESLPEAGYVEEDIPRDDMDFGRDLSGYAIIEKREKPPRPPPPRRKRDKFATTPRPVPPKRPQRAYSTLGPGKTRDSTLVSETFATTLEAESMPYIEIDSDDGEHKDLRSSEVLSKMQSRPLPAPPRPPRVRKERSLDRSAAEQELLQELVQEYSMQETTTATQTDPLPDDVVIEEEVTQAKLVVAPSRSGSQIMISTERIPTPLSVPTPPVPPLPVTQRLRKEEHAELAYDTVSLKSPSPTRELEALEDRHLSAPQLEESRDEDARLRSIRAAFMSDEPVRIGNLEVGDLRVDRLSVSQIEAGKIVASEVDALVITASELKNMGVALEESLSPSIIRELVAIRSHLEAVALARAQESRREERRAVEADRKTDIPVVEGESVEKTPLGEQTVQQDPVDERRSVSAEDQKVVKREVTRPTDREIPKTITHTLTIAQVEIEEPPVTQTLSVSRVELGDRDIPSTQHSPEVPEATEDKSLRILDSESPLYLSPAIDKEPAMGEPLTTPPVTPTEDIPVEPRLSPEPASEAESEHTEPIDSKVPPEFLKLAAEREEEGSTEVAPQKPKRRSRSRSASPIDIPRTRQTASPVRSLPPAISVTPDTPDCVTSHSTSYSGEIQPQRAVISYSPCIEQYEGDSLRESSSSPAPAFPLGGTHLIAFPASQVPAQFLSLAAQTGQRVDTESSVRESTRQLLSVLRVAGIKAMRHFVEYVSSRVGGEETREKIRDVELTLCALLLLVIGLLIFFFSNPRTVMHHHHWDYFNPPK